MKTIRTIKNLMFICAAVLLCATCGDDKEKETTAIEVGNATTLTQTVYADKTSGTSGVSFVTTGAWTSTITEGSAKSTKAGAASWISISPDHGDAAGAYTINISLAPNTSGEDRTATITIACNGEEIKITVTQTATTQEGKPLDPGNTNDNDDDDEEPFSSAITMTTNRAVMMVALRGTGHATVHWPDGDQTKMLEPYDTTRFICYFSTAQNRTITISGENITYLYCVGNELLTLDVGNNTALTELHCSINKLTTLDVSKLTALEYLECGDNQLASLDVSKNTALRGLVCSRNQFTSLDVSGIALGYLAVGGEQLTSLDVSKLTTLSALSVEGFTSLDVSKLTTLKELYVYNSTFTSLDISKLTALKDLRFNGNPELTSLNASGLTALEYLEVNGNVKLTSLNVSGCTVLNELDCSGNQLTTSGLNALFETLPDRSDSFNIRLKIDGNPGTDDCNRSIATNKNWYIF